MLLRSSINSFDDFDDFNDFDDFDNSQVRTVSLTNKKYSSYKYYTTFHSKLRAKSSHAHLVKKLYQLSRVDFYLPMGSKSLWF